MKHSIKGLFVISAIVVSFVLVQGAWAGPELVELEGIVITVENCAIGLDTNMDGETDETIYHIGPKWYWLELGLSYPVVDGNLKIQVYDSSIGYVLVSVWEGSEFVYLRELDTYKPLWIQHPKTADLSGTAVEGTGDGEPIKQQLKDGYVYDNNYDHDYDYNYDEPGPHQTKNNP